MPRQPLEDALVQDRDAAGRGDAQAQYRLGTLYQQGRGVRQNAAEAAAWYRRAAEQGHAEAQYALGVLYAEGRGVPQDYEQAAIWYRQAAERGHADAQFLLGALYESGQGMPQDDAQAVFWYSRAAEQGHAYAPGALGALIEQGRGIRLDQPHAAGWLQRMAEEGGAACWRCWACRTRQGVTCGGLRTGARHAAETARSGLLRRKKPGAADGETVRDKTLRLERRASGPPVSEGTAGRSGEPAEERHPPRFATDTQMRLPGHDATGQRLRRVSRRTAFAAVALLGLLGGSAAWAEEPVSAVVLRVLDGDTLEVRLGDGTLKRVRLDGIDCPEKAQPYGMDARMAAAQLVEGGRVRLAPRGRDKYGRLIARVETPDGRSVNERLVEEGHCWWYRKYAPDNRRLEQFEAEARAAARGLWAEPDPVPPWQWRKGRQAERGAEGGER